MGPNSSFQSVLQTSHILEETDNFVVEGYGATLPVTVTEILTLTEKTSDVSVCLNPNGWAWLVHGRRLVVWRYSKAKPLSTNCRELTLPPSDLSHDAKLVNVFSANENQTPSCIAVSPEGTVRYWPSIAHSGSSYEVNSDLQGQECYSLTDLQPLGSILTTTTATVVLIYQENSCGQHSIASRLLKPPQGLLGGIGRRVSSLLWGSMATGNSEAKLVQVLGCKANPIGSSLEDPFEKFVYVLTSNSFQKWLLIQGEPDKMFYSCDLETLAKEAFATHLWANQSADPSWIKVWLLDMQLTNEGCISVLMAAYNPRISQQIHYAIGMLATMTNAPPIQFRLVSILKHNIAYNDQDSPGSSSSNCSNGLDYKFLLPASHGHKVGFIYNGSSVLCTQVGTSSDPDPDQLDFGSGGNAILGAGHSCDGQGLFFSVTHGMVTIQPSHQPQHEQSNLTFNDSLTADKATRLSESLNLSVSQAGLDNLTMSESKKDQLKAAFLLFCKRHMSQATSIVHEMFPLSDEVFDNDSALDRLVVAMSADLIDDFPASDPRWMKSVPNSESSIGIGSTMSLLILHQLEDKQTALEVYISFLKEVGLWQRLTGVSARELIMATSLLLAEHVEKTVATITLWTVQSENLQLVESAIKKTLKNRKTVQPNESSLTAQDQFYRQISKVEEIVDGFQMVADELVVSARPPKEIVVSIMAINNIILTMFKHCLRVREQKKHEFWPERVPAKDFEYLPWTAAPGPKGLRTLFSRQFQLTLNKAVPLAEDAEERKDLYKQLVDLADLVLDGYNGQISTIQDASRKSAVLKQYEKDRTALINPLVKQGCLEQAASLAEKYLEFNALVKICELTNDNDRLEKYMDTFSDQNFANYVFDWHVREGKQSRLLAQSYTGHRQGQLGQFLEGHSQISWLHDFQTGQYTDAAVTLKQLATNEIKMVSKKKTLLSLAKLSALASDQPPESIEMELAGIEHDLNVIAAQERLPKTLMDNFGFDPTDMRPLNPRELIELYIGEENSDSDQIDFKTALDLIEYLPPVGGTPQEITADKEALRLRIWAKSILKDKWLELDTDQPIEAIRDTVFFRLVEFCYLQGLDLKEHLPAPDRLLEAPDLTDLKTNANFQFLLRTGYEYVRRHCASEP